MTYGTKDVLDDLDGSGPPGGYCIAILVGHGSDYTTGRFELVDRLPQWMVLAY